MVRYIEITADDEMPDCGKCDHCCDDFDCGKLCGAEHGWLGYRRKVWFELTQKKGGERGWHLK